MSLRLEMLQVARLAPSLLGEDASELVRDFLFRSQDEESGGFLDRDGSPDLYYTSFAIDALTALQIELPSDQLLSYLQNQSEPDQLEKLDFVHLCCLARCFSALTKTKPDCLDSIFSHLESRYRSAEGGYNQVENAATGSAYACFLAYGAYSDHHVPVPNPEGVGNCLRGLQTVAGSWANDVEIPVPNIPATAAAVTLCRNLRLPIPAETIPWVLSCFHPGGGFLPFPGAPMPDLLSTAVALHALDGLQADFSAYRESALDYVDTLWTAAGGFHGSWDDDDLDIEYTYYGLLALGHLAL